MSGGLESAWTERARAAIAWREGESIEAVLEALALSVALEAVGALAEAPPSLRDDLRRVGQRAMLHLSAEIPSGGDAADGDREEALRIAAWHARDGLRALSGKAPEREPPGEPPSARDLARLIAGTAEPFEAAAIARRARASDQARRELGWAMRLRRTEAAPAQAPIRLAAADGEPMRDPSAGRHLASIREADAVIAEVYAFGGGALAVYAASGEPVRLDAPGARTDAEQPGYWSGRVATGELEGTLCVGERRFHIAVRVE